MEGDFFCQVLAKKFSHGVKMTNWVNGIIPFAQNGESGSMELFRLLKMAKVCPKNFLITIQSLMTLLKT